MPRHDPKGEGQAEACPSRTLVPLLLLPRAEDEQVLPRVLDRVADAVVRLKEVGPGPVQLLAAFVVERRSQALGRSVACQEQLPVLLAARDRERRVAFVDLEVVV